MCFRMTSSYEPRRIEQAKKKQEADEAKERKEKGLSPVSENLGKDITSAKTSSASKDSSPGSKE